MVVAALTSQQRTWTTGLSGGSGTVTLTTLAGTRAAGTFTLVVQGLGADALPAQRHVTNGTFDVFVLPTP